MAARFVGDGVVMIFSATALLLLRGKLLIASVPGGSSQQCVRPPLKIFERSFFVGVTQLRWDVAATRMRS